jgi:hypothetical protein
MGNESCSCLNSGMLSVSVDNSGRGACLTMSMLSTRAATATTQGSPNRTWHGNTLDIETKPR